MVSKLKSKHNKWLNRTNLKIKVEVEVEVMRNNRINNQLIKNRIV